MTPVLLGLLGDHLWQSTVFGSAVAILVLGLTKNRARTRYWIWWIASVKFLIPFSFLMRLGAELSSPVAPVALSEPLIPAAVIEQATQPFTFDSVPRPTVIAASAASGAARVANIVPLVLAIWAVGCLLVSLKWQRRWRRAKSVIRNAAVLKDGREVEAVRRLERALGISEPTTIVRSNAAVEPSVFGIFHSVLVWPAGLSERLSSEELHGILLHELSHVRRRDNLRVLPQVFVESVFWFHPLVWWIGVRLVQEREKACDENVLYAGGASYAYAEGILKVCEFCIESPLACGSGVTGADLMKRVEDIMRNRVVHNLSYSKVLLLVAAAVVAIGGPIAAGILVAQGRQQDPSKAPSADVAIQSFPSPAQERSSLALVQLAAPSASRGSTAPPQSPRRETFDVVSIRQSVVTPGTGVRGQQGGGGGPRSRNPRSADEPCSFPVEPVIDPRRFETENSTVLQLLSWAYAMDCYADTPLYLSGGPNWIRETGYDVQATRPEGPSDYIATAGTPSRTRPGPKLRLMLQSMLEDRFKLVVHREMREMPVYFLSTAPTGPKFTRSRPPRGDEGGRAQNAPGNRAPAADAVIPEFSVWKDGDNPCCDGGAFTSVDGRKKSIAELAKMLAMPTQMARPVIDRTGLTGLYNYYFEYLPADVPGRTMPPIRGPQPTQSIFKALEQVGLELKPGREKVEVLVIDRIERPSEN